MTEICNISQQRPSLWPLEKSKEKTMRSRIHLPLLSASLLLLFAIGQARAQWLDAHVKPGANENYERNLQVKIKTVGRWEEVEVIVTPHAGAKELKPLEFSHA